MLAEGVDPRGYDDRLLRQIAVDVDQAVFLNEIRKLRGDTPYADCGDTPLIYMAAAAAPLNAAENPVAPQPQEAVKALQQAIRQLSLG